MPHISLIILLFTLFACSLNRKPGGLELLEQRHPPKKKQANKQSLPILYNTNTILFTSIYN